MELIEFNRCSLIYFIYITHITYLEEKLFLEVVILHIPNTSYLQYSLFNNKEKNKRTALRLLSGSPTLVLTQLVVT